MCLVLRGLAGFLACGSPHKTLVALVYESVSACWNGLTVVWRTPLRFDGNVRPFLHR